MQRRNTIMYRQEETKQPECNDSHSSADSFGRSATDNLEATNGPIDFFRMEAIKQDPDMPYEKAAADSEARVVKKLTKSVTIEEEPISKRKCRQKSFVRDGLSPEQTRLKGRHTIVFDELQAEELEKELAAK